MADYDPINAYPSEEQQQEMVRKGNKYFWKISFLNFAVVFDGQFRIFYLIWMMIYS